MLPTTLILLLVAPFTAYAQCTKSTTNSCSTVMATVPQWWPVLTATTTTQLKTLTLTGSTTVYVNKTVAAVPITVNSTTTTTVGVTTTATPGTDTAYYTQTVTVTTAGTTTTVTTGTVTSTVISTSTSWSIATVAAPSGFISAYGSSGDTNYAGAKRAAARRSNLKARTQYELEKRSLLSDLLALFGIKATTPTTSKTSLPRFNALNWVNPIAVNCVAKVAPTCRVGATVTSTLTTTAAPSTFTSTVQATAFTTQVVIPGNVTSTITIATSTATFSTSVLVTSTAITTVTSTLTSVVTSVTSTYAACATPNILGSRLASGAAISKVYFYDSSAVVATTPQKSAYDCCVACQTGNSCQYFQYTGSNGQCYVIGGDANWCPNNQQDYSTPAYFTYDEASNVSEAVYVGNGVCGIVMNAGHV